MVRFFCDNSHSPFIAGLNFTRKKDDDIYSFWKSPKLKENIGENLCLLAYNEKMALLTASSYLFIYVSYYNISDGLCFMVLQYYPWSGWLLNIIVNVHPVYIIQDHYWKIYEYIHH